MIDAGHGVDTPGKRAVDGMKEYEFNSAVAHKLKEFLLMFKGISVLYAHSDSEDVPLHVRTNSANLHDVDLFISIHANAHGDGKDWTSAEGIETFVYQSKPKAATELATLVQAELVKKTKRKDRGVKTAKFYVLEKTKMTAILCECGFMTNKQEAALLRSDDYRTLCAKAIASGLSSYYNLSKVKPTPSTPIYKVQVGAFSHKQNATKLAKELKNKGYHAIIVK
ncbi:N-acetylmuramoyl-L-alanine amidase [Metabacillus litoralis]|uniref:N-acetylmuramoyl-L-alanine amidase n=1 Tax=Metabacillus litoralis TaxID=152268 RepID=UPI001CFC62C7|nr:N-acetylmuramoyl-L-alanine amidase [Metabacillus litoralis]